MARSVLACPSCGKTLPHEVQNRQMLPKKWYCSTCHTESHRSELVRVQDFSVARSKTHHHPVHPHRSGGGGAHVFGPLDFPKPWLYWGTNGFGNPAMGTTGQYNQGSFNMSQINAAARFSLVTMNVHPFCSNGPGDSVNRGIVALMKAARPTIKLLWYDTFVQAIAHLYVGGQWQAISALSIGPPDVRLYCNDGSFFPFNAAGVWWFDTGRVKTDLLSLWLSRGWLVADTDGFFLDFGNGTLFGDSSNGSPLDLTRTAWTTAAELDASGKAGLDYVVDGMHAAGAEVWVNGTADATSVARWNGRLFEGWDPDNGANGSSDPAGPFNGFDDAMASLLTWQGATPTGDGTGLVHGEDHAGTGGGTPYNTAAWRKMQRYVLGSATIAGGYGAVTDRDNNVTPPVHDEDKWADEYTVVNGISQNTASNGWLGRPTEFGYKDSGGCYVRHFDNGLVVVNGDGTTSHSFDVGSGYRRIQGIYDTSVNNGASVSGSQTIPGKDARFYLRG